MVRQSGSRITLFFEQEDIILYGVRYVLCFVYDEMRGNDELWLGGLQCVLFDGTMCTCAVPYGLLAVFFQSNVGEFSPG